MGREDLPPRETIHLRIDALPPTPYRASFAPAPSRPAETPPADPHEAFAAAEAPWRAEAQAISVHQAPPAPAGKAWSVSACAARALPIRPDGGIPVEAETGTVAYTGEAAEQFLGVQMVFDKETEFVFPEGSVVSVEVSGETCLFAEPGVVLMAPGAQARVDLREGRPPLVITSERPPAWYRKHRAEEPFYEDLAQVNQRLVDGRTTLRSAFRPALLEQLLEGGILHAEEDGRRVRWEEMRSPEELARRLEPLGLDESEKAECEKAWSDTLARGLYGLQAGRFPRDRMKEDQALRLTEAGLLHENSLCPQELFWARYHPESELRQTLAESGFQGAELEGVVDLWRATSRAGYDTTGLAWNKDGVTLYTHRGRLNMWSEEPTEWLVASTSFTGQSEPFTVGVSTVRAEAGSSGPRAFREIRPAETLHRHPVSQGASQTEAYLVHRGSGALLTLRDGKPVLHLLAAGDMALVEPGVMHSVLAVNGDYEQLVFQVPSTFQYGFRFKESHDYQELGLDYEEVLAVAQQELAKGTRGAVVIASPPRAQGAPDILAEVP